MTAEEIKEKVLALISSGAVTYEQLAYALHVTYTTIYYQLHTAKKLDFDFVNSLEQFLNNHGMAISKEGNIMLIKKLILEFITLIANALDILSMQIKLMDMKKLDKMSKDELLAMMDDFEINFKNEIDKIKKVIQ
jgi:hypothetical protein